MPHAVLPPSTPCARNEAGASRTETLWIASHAACAVPVGWEHGDTVSACTHTDTHTHEHTQHHSTSRICVRRSSRRKSTCSSSSSVYAVVGANASSIDPSWSFNSHRVATVSPRYRVRTKTLAHLQVTGDTEDVAQGVHLKQVQVNVKLASQEIHQRVTALTSITCDTREATQPTSQTTSGRKRTCVSAAERDAADAAAAIFFAPPRLAAMALDGGIDCGDSTPKHGGFARL